MAHAFIVGGSGQIGLAVARRLLADGWTVTCAQRNPDDLPADLRGRVMAVALDRKAPGALEAALGEGADALIDTVAYGPEQGRQLLAVQGGVGAIAVISTGSVYRAEGTAADAKPGPTLPRLPVPVREDHPRWASGDGNYSTEKVALEDVLFDGALGGLTVVRPWAIYGPGCRSPREWWFLKRILEDRRTIPLAYEGRSVFHTSASANIAELIRVSLATPGVRALNAADPEALSVRQIGEVILAATGSTAALSPVSGMRRDRVGATPWSVADPIVADMSAAEALGYRPLGGYRDFIGETLRDLRARASGRPWRDAFPGLAPYPDAMFEYEAEDAFFAKQGIAA